MLRLLLMKAAFAMSSEPIVNTGMRNCSLTHQPYSCLPAYKILFCTLFVSVYADKKYGKYSLLKYHITLHDLCSIPPYTKEKNKGGPSNGS